MAYPHERPRRLRQHPGLRRLTAETTLSAHRLIQPLFVVAGRGVETPIPGLPGVSHLSVDRIVESGQRLVDRGIPAALLFGVPKQKDAEGSGAWAADGVVQQAALALRESVPDLVVMTDVCLCAYTDHGHCGVMRKDVEGRGTRGRRTNSQDDATDCIDNDASLPLLARIAVSHAQAGAHMVAPSDMMDGRVGSIRAALDEAGFVETAIMSYAVKYASAFYGPFREAQHSTPQSGDRRSYQMDPAAGVREAIREARLDVEEGADIIMVKPALPYLDVIRALREALDVPIAAYQVSGEFAMIKAAAAAGALDEASAMHEALLAIRRAGADCIISYGAAEIARND
jgi:porphobilinogen synthase